MRRQLFITTFLTSIAFAGAGHAGCFADYKAKRDNPLKLHYGVIEIDSDPCTMSDKVQSMVSKRLSKAGWTLLNVQSVFDDAGLEGKKRDAGEFFLSF